MPKVQQTMSKISAQEKVEIRAMIERMRQAYDVDKKDLPRIFGVEPKSINNWVHYGRRPYEQMRQCHLSTGASMDWLHFGIESQSSLTQKDIRHILSLMQDALKGAVDYKTLTFRYPDARENLIEKFKNDLEKWFGEKTAEPETNGDKPD